MTSVKVPEPPVISVEPHYLCTCVFKAAHMYYCGPLYFGASEFKVDHTNYECSKIVWIHCRVSESKWARIIHRLHNMMNSFAWRGCPCWPSRTQALKHRPAADGKEHEEWLGGFSQEVFGYRDWTSLAAVTLPSYLILWVQNWQAVWSASTNQATATHQDNWQFLEWCQDNHTKFEEAVLWRRPSRSCQSNLQTDLARQGSCASTWVQEQVVQTNHLPKVQIAVPFKGAARRPGCQALYTLSAT